HCDQAISPNRISASTSRDAVSWLGRLKTGEWGGGVMVAMSKKPTTCYPWACLSLSIFQRAGREVVAVGGRHLDADDVARPQGLALDPNDAVDLRCVGVAPAEHVVGHFGVGRVDDRLQFPALLTPAPPERDLLLGFHHRAPALLLHFLAQVIFEASGRRPR